MFLYIIAGLRIRSEIESGCEEALIRADEKSGYRSVLTQTFLPMWDTDLAAKAMGNLKALLKSVPVYEASSGPDCNSVRRLWELTERKQHENM